MTLFRQILMVILLGFAVNLMGVLWLEFDTTRGYLNHQLESDLNNASTSMGMALTPHMAEGDKVMVESTLNAYFDGGFYQRIDVDIFSNGEQVSKQVPLQINGVPRWFVELELINAPSVTTTLTDGWLQVGELTIQGHPGFAYKKLWETLVVMTSWLGGLSLLLTFCASLGIRVVLNPLRRIQKKAEEIQERRFGEPLPLPRTEELQSVTATINRMSSKLQEQFEEEARLHDKLKAQAFIDATTGFGNRAFFNQQLQAWLSDAPAGAVVMLELNGLDEINKRDGWLQRDKVVRSAAQLIDNSLDELTGAVKCRLSANEFALILDGLTAEQVPAAIERLAAQLSMSSFKGHFHKERNFTLGAVVISATAGVSAVLSLADNAMQQARQENVTSRIVEQDQRQGDSLSRQALKQAIVEAVDHSSLGFVRQPVFSFGDDEAPLHYEAFAKLKLATDADVNASLFISVLDEFELGDAFDKKVIELLLAHLAGGDNHRYAVNLTASALKNESFIHWLIDTLADHPACRDQLCLEFTEESVIYNKGRIEYLCQHLTRLGVEFGVDRVGRNFSSLAYLQSINPSYVKIDHAFTQSALNGKDDAYFVGSLCTTIHNLDIEVIATRVENPEQLALLKDYHFDGYQGYIVKPEAFSLAAEQETA